MAKLAVTSRTVVTIGLIALNLDALLRFLHTLIQQWHIWQALMTAKYRARFCCYPSLTWIYAPAIKLRAAA
jgi:hypothetical protein